MTAERLATAAYPLLLCAGIFIIGLLCLAEARRIHRAEARAAEQQARPHSEHVGTEAEDAAAILRGRLPQSEQP